MSDNDETTQRFNNAVQVIQSLPKDSNFQPSQEMMLRFYSLFKQAKYGPCTGSRPSFWDPVGRTKHDSWQSLGNMSRREAMEQYVDELKKIIEVMPQTDAVGRFTRSLGRFYEIYVEKPENGENSTHHPVRTPSPIHPVSNGHLPSPIGEENGEENISEDEDTESRDSGSEEEDDEFADTIEIQPAAALQPIDQPDATFNQLPSVGLAMERLQTDIACVSARLSDIERSLGELLANSRRERRQMTTIALPQFHSLSAVLRRFRIPSRIRSLVLFLLPIIAGYLLARRFFFIRRR